MPSSPDPYRVLGVAREATAGDIRSAHRRLAKQFHPDATEGDTERFMAVQEAYQVLNDPLKRREWDARHRPGPVRADTTPRARPGAARGSAGRASPTARGSARGRGASATAGDDDAAQPPAGDPGAARPRASRTQTNRQRRRPDPFSPSDRQPTSDSYTWSAQDVPWWSSGPDRSRRGRSGATPTDPAEPTEPPEAAADPAGGQKRANTSGSDFDVYNRSSGAAWSMASRAYFRRAGSDVPTGAAEPFGQRWTTPPGRPSSGPGPNAAASHAARSAPRSSARPAAGPPRHATGASRSASMGGARGVVFGAPAPGFARRAREASVQESWPSLGGRLLYATLGWLAPAAALVLAPISIPVPVTSAVLSALAVALLLAPRPAYLAAVGGAGALVAGAGLALGQAASGGTMGLAFDTLASAIVVMVYIGAVIVAWLDWPIPRPWTDQP